MSDWLTSSCQLLPPDMTSLLGIACAALVVLLVALIALGFGPSQTWLGLGSTQPRGRAAPSDDGLFDAWHLYQQLRRGGATQR